MKGQSNAAQTFAFTIILVVLALYFVYLQLRCLRYRKIAAELGAEYDSQGLFKTGEIAGSSNGRKYTIRTRDVAVGKSSSTWTDLSMDCVNRGIPLQIQGGFFKTFPNWKYAFTLGDRKERVFTSQITIQNAFVLLEGRDRAGVQSLFQEMALLHHDLLKKGNIRIRQDQVSFSIRGVLKGVAVTREMIALFETIAGRIESAPIA